MTRTAIALFTGDLLSLHAGDDLRREALVDGERRFTYGDLQQLVAAAAARMAQLGVVRGDRVVVHLRKSCEEVVALFACWQLGAIAVDVHAQWTVEQLAYVAADCGAKLVVLDGRRAADLEKQGLPAPLEHALVVGTPPPGPFSPWPGVGAGTASAPQPPLLDVDVAAILYTSGSTGSPKGVMFTHANLLVGARSVARYTGQHRDDRLLSLLPFSFDYGLNQLLTAFLLGARVVLQAVAMPTVLVDTIAREGITGFAAVPPVWIPFVRLLEQTHRALPSLRYVTNSGGAIPQAILDAMPRVLPGVRIHLMYGLTEAFRSTALPPERFAAKRGSMGQAVPNVETFVVVRGRGLAEPGEVGELVHRGSFISKGYWGRPEDTAQRIRPAAELADRIGDEPVVWSGDLVRADADGDLWFVGRNDSMIKAMGFRVSPTEVEDMVFRSGLVDHIVAFGVADELAGQAVEVCVVLRAGGDADAVAAWARAHLPHYMHPRRVHVWPGELPRTASGKIDVPKVVAACVGRQDDASGDGLLAQSSSS